MNKERKPLTADLDVMREAAQSVECLRAEVLRLQIGLAADPLRQMLEEVVCFLEELEDLTPEDGDSHELLTMAQQRASALLTGMAGLRTLTPTEGGTDQ